MNFLLQSVGFSPQRRPGCDAHSDRKVSFRQRFDVAGNLRRTPISHAIHLAVAHVTILVACITVDDDRHLKLFENCHCRRSMMMDRGGEDGVKMISKLDERLRDVVEKDY